MRGPDTPGAGVPGGQASRIEKGASEHREAARLSTPEAGFTHQTLEKLTFSQLFSPRIISFV